MVRRTIIMGYSGGLGNKLFQYALSLRFAAEGHRVLHEITPACVGQKETPFQLTRIFGVILRQPFLAPSVYRIAARLNKFGLYHLWSSFFWQVVNDESPLGFNSEVLRAARDRVNRPLLLRGYWQNPKYFIDFRQHIQSAMRWPSEHYPGLQSLLGQIESGDAVGIHFRRGDYVALNNGLSLEYYRRAIKKVREAFSHPRFFLFSDDLKYVNRVLSELFLPGDSLTVVDSKGEPDWGDLFLMTRCQGLVIANSTYSWWAAFLNEREGAIVWAPREWYVGKPVEDFFPNEWRLVPSMEDAGENG